MKPPESLFSKATIRHVGLCPATAYRKWNSWQNWSPIPPWRETDPEQDWGDEMPFIHFLTGCTGAGMHVWGEDDAVWRECMAKCGMSDEMQDAIMDPAFREVRLRETCEFWMEQTMEMRYEALTAEFEREGHVHPNTVAWMVERDRIVEISTTGETEATDTDCVTLYGATTAERYRTMYDSTGRTRVNFLPFCTRAPSDFSPSGTVLSLFADADVANLHAAYIHRRGGTATVVSMLIPRAAFAALAPGESLALHQDDDDWRQVVYYSRRGRHGMPRRLRQYGDDEEGPALVETPVGRWPGQAYKELQSWEDVNGSFAWRWRGEVRKWCVFSYWTGGKFLRENIKEMRARKFGEDEFKKWMEESAR
ncbi:hypothetical protein PWT90_02306 [Aphanocladium album]|nr:hypothetical protein PWT90_02306 [Aphanocladium album]